MAVVADDVFGGLRKQAVNLVVVRGSASICQLNQLQVCHLVEPIFNLVEAKFQESKIAIELGLILARRR